MSIRINSNNKKINPIQLPIIRETHNIVVKENIDETLRIAQIEIGLKLNGIVASNGNKKSGTYGIDDLKNFAKRLGLSSVGNKSDLIDKISEYYKILAKKQENTPNQNTTYIYDPLRQNTTGIYG